MISLYRKLSANGVLGLNRRNAELVSLLNQRNSIIAADDKILTKELAQKHEVVVPKLYAILEHQAELQHVEKILAPHSDFVVKPARGSGGKGIIIITETIKDKFRKPSGAVVSLPQLREHISNILSGIFSLGSDADKAIIEYRVIADPVFDRICFHGVPDIRIIVYKGYPVMAMARLPTINSDGKANLHQGAIGVGIDIATGVTHHGVMGNEPIDEHPDTLNPINGIEIPLWQEILRIATSSYEMTQLGYFGVDMVIDKTLGPMVLEFNARPGLNIQIANNEGLLNRIRAIDKLEPQEKTWFSERIDIACKLFG